MIVESGTMRLCTSCSTLLSTTMRRIEDFGIGDPGNPIDIDGDPKEVPNNLLSAYFLPGGVPTCWLTSGE